MRRLTVSKLIGGTLFWLMCLIVLASSGCAPRLRNVLFNTPKEYMKYELPMVHINPDSHRIAAGYEHRIQVDDQVAIRFLNNLDIAEGMTMAEGSSPLGVAFLVNHDGDIDLPMVGKLKVMGMTKQEAKQAIENKYGVQYKDPKVELTILNLSVSVQGEVSSPGIFKLERERTTLIEVLSMAGGISQYGKRNVIKVVRGVGQRKDPEILIFDLRQLESVKTEELYVQDKDIVYVEPRDVKVASEKVLPYTNFLSIFSTIGVIASIIISVTKEP